MPTCVAFGCTNSDLKGFRMFTFPKNKERRQRWKINCRWENWEPTSSSRLCQVHFEECQFEANRQDGWKKLKPNAIPTLFSVPNPPPMIGIVRRNPLERKRANSNQKNDENCAVSPKKMPRCNSKLVCQDDIGTSDMVAVRDTELPDLTGSTNTNNQDKALIHKLQTQIRQLQKKLATVKNEKQNLISSLTGLFNPDQLEALGKKGDKLKGMRWSKETILKGLQHRFALGVHGYEFILEKGYPLPSYATLNRKLQNLDFSFGILHNIVPFFKDKVRCMTVNALDKMEISDQEKVDKYEMIFVGGITLGDKTKNGNHLLVVLARDISTPWKQVIAYAVTGPSTTGTEMQTFVKDVVKTIRESGLTVSSQVTEMGASNKALLVKQSVGVTRSEGVTSYQLDVHPTPIHVFANVHPTPIHVFADVPHLLKSLWRCLLQQDRNLSMDIVNTQDLPSSTVSNTRIKKLVTIQLNH